MAEVDLLDRYPRTTRNISARAAAVPKELAAATLGTLREAPWQPDFDAAVATEIERQTWSMGMGWFRPQSGD